MEGGIVMYKPNKRKLAKGRITAREDGFHSHVYEYTLYCEDHEIIARLMRDWVSTLNKNVFRFKNLSDEVGFVILVAGDARFEFYQKRTKQVQFADGSVRTAVEYYGMYTDFCYFPPYLHWGDEMNEIMTTLEMILIGVDPLTWIRTIPMQCHRKNDRGEKPERWEIKKFDPTLSREEAAQRHMPEGYLADRLNATGMSVYGGTPYAQTVRAGENPLITERIQRNLKKAEERKNAPKDNKPEEKREEGLKKYPGYFLVSVGEPLDPFIHAEIDKSRNIIMEPQDHQFIELRASGISMKRRMADSQTYMLEYENTHSFDNYIYISDSRIAFINRKYNRDEAGGWIGFGGGGAYVFAEAMNLMSKGVKAAQRHDKALAGHIRYEWLGMVTYRHKYKTFGHEQIQFYYKDQEKSTWALTVDLPGGSDAEVIANDIVKKACHYRLRMSKEYTQDVQDILFGYLNGKPIEKESDPSEYCAAPLPGQLFASLGEKYRPQN